jgi:hypothetical protein
MSAGDPELDFLIAELRALREQYICASPSQRLRVATQRVINPGAIPNLLVTNVSAVEALARSLVMHQHASSRQELVKVYGRFKSREAHTLVSDYLRSQDKEPKAYFGDTTWAAFRLAVNYRNLLVHECTYIAVPKFNPLVRACRDVIDGLKRLARLREPRV